MTAARKWHSEPVDRSGTMAFVHLIRSPDDAERTPRPKGGRKDRAPHLTMRRKGPAAIVEWKTAIRAKLADGKPRTFNTLCVEIGDITADIAFCEAPNLALWELVCDGELEHTIEAPILFRLTPKRFATTRQFTGKLIYRAYVYEGNRVVWTCNHNHRKAETAQACADRALANWKG